MNRWPQLALARRDLEQSVEAFQEDAHLKDLVEPICCCEYRPGR